MENQDNLGKAAGSSDHKGQHHRDSVSASPSQPTYSRPRLSHQNSNYGEPQASANQTRSHPYASITLPSSQPQAPTQRMSSNHTTSRRNSKVFQSPTRTISQASQVQDTDSTSSETWDLLEEGENNNTPPSAALTTYNFPGTWPAALHDTSVALTSVGAATTSYASALTRSGIGKAGWSIGSALASTANQRALKVVDWAADRTGTGADQLPRPIGRWLKGGRERMKKVRRARTNRERRGEGEIVWGDEQGPFVLETSLVSSAGEPLRNDDGWEVADTKGGRQVSGEEDGEQEDEMADGLVRLFEFDD